MEFYASELCNIIEYIDSRLEKKSSNFLSPDRKYLKLYSAILLYIW